MTAVVPRVLVRVCLLAVLTTGVVVGVSPPASADASPNLVKNFGAEAPPGGNYTGNPGSVPQWLSDVPGAAIRYGALRFFPTSSTPGPANRGSSLFYGGKRATSTPSETGDFTAFSQTINLSPYVAKINGGAVKVSIVGWLGGYASDKDYAILSVNMFHDGTFLKQVPLVGPTPAERGNTTKLIKRSATTSVPKTTNTIIVQVSFRGFSGLYSDGTADNIIIKLQNL